MIFLFILLVMILFGRMMWWACDGFRPWVKK